MHIPKCQDIFNLTVFNLLRDLIYFLINKVLTIWKNCETSYICWHWLWWAFFLGKMDMSFPVKYCK